jgi:hypothetical protein
LVGDFDTSCPHCGAELAAGAAAARKEDARKWDEKQLAAAARRQPRGAAAPALGLTACGTCEGKLARAAVTCPHCGAPGPGRRAVRARFEQPEDYLFWAGIPLIALGGVCGIVGLVTLVGSGALARGGLGAVLTLVWGATMVWSILTSGALLMTIARIAMLLRDRL